MNRPSDANKNRRLTLICSVLCACLSVVSRSADAQNDVEQNSSGEIMLLVRSDDMGVAHAVNEACLATVTDGIARSIEVIVPGPWFIEAAEMLNKHPDIDVGVHLDLTSEWSHVKWGPVSQNVSSLIDANGHFFPMTRQRPDWPPNTGFLDSNWKIGEVERELRAQIEMALRHLPKVSHVTAHMGTATSTPELKQLVRQADMDQAEQLFARVAGRDNQVAFDTLLYTIADEVDVHRFVIAYRGYGLIDVAGPEHAHTLLRQCVRHCVDFEQKKLQ